MFLIYKREVETWVIVVRGSKFKVDNQKMQDTSKNSSRRINAHTIVNYPILCIKAYAKNSQDSQIYVREMKQTEISHYQNKTTTTTQVAGVFT